MAVKAPDPHWVRQGRGEDGRFETFRDDNPAPAAEPASWLNKAQRRRLEAEFPRRYQPDSWGGSELYDKALEALRRGEDHDDIWRKYGAIDPVPGRSPNAFKEEDGRPLVYAPDANWTRQDGLNLIGRDGFKSGYENEAPLNMFLQGDPLRAQRIGDTPTTAVKDPTLQSGTSRGVLKMYPEGDLAGIDVAAPTLTDFGQVLRHEADHAGIWQGALETGRHPFARPGDDMIDPTYGAQRENKPALPGSFGETFYEALGEIRPESDIVRRKRDVARDTMGYAYNPEEFRVMQGDQLARLPRGQHKDVPLSRLDPMRMDPSISQVAALTPAERARVIEVVRKLGPLANIDDVQRHLGLPVAGDTQSVRDAGATRYMRGLMDE